MIKTPWNAKSLTSHEPTFDKIRTNKTLNSYANEKMMEERRSERDLSIDLKKKRQISQLLKKVKKSSLTNLYRINQIVEGFDDSGRVSRK